MTTGAPGFEQVRVDRQTAVRLGRAVASFVGSEVGYRALTLAGALLGLLLTINGLNVVNSYVGRDFMTAIERRDGSRFVREALLYLGVFAASTLAAVLYRFIEERLGLLWREFITRRMVSGYLDNRFYYWLNVAGTIANPDQRIADDVRTFTTTTLSLSLVFLNGAITILAFSGVLWSISRLLFVVAVGYAVVGSVLTVALGRTLVGLNYDQADREASFRADLVHVRENAESVAMFHREGHLKARLVRRVDALTENLKRIIAVNRNLGFFTTGYNYLIQLLPALIVAPLFIYGSAEFGVIPQSAMAFAHVLGAFSLVVTQFPQLSSYAVVLARLTPLVEAVETVPSEKSRVAVVEEQGRFAFERLTLRMPRNGTPLVRELSIEIPERFRLLVIAPTELVTTALLRAMVGIWENGEGRIVRPALEDVMLLPDRPYLPPGTLRELLLGTDGARALPADRLGGALREVGVDAAVDRVGGLDVEGDWDNVLSLEEQRQIGLARILLAAPRLAVLAQLEAGLGVEHAAVVLAALAARGIGYMALGGDALARESFDAVLEIASDGTWSVTAIGEAKA